MLMTMAVVAGSLAAIAGSPHWGGSVGLGGSLLDGGTVAEYAFRHRRDVVPVVSVAVRRHTIGLVWVSVRGAYLSVEGGDVRQEGPFGSILMRPSSRLHFVPIVPTAELSQLLGDV